MSSSGEYSDSEGASVYELLSASERIIDGSVSFDWRKIPVDLLDSLPDSDKPPKSASKELVKAKRKSAMKVPEHVEDVEREEENIHQLPLTFNNCHFHLEGKKDIVFEEGVSPSDTSKQRHKQTINSLIAERMSKLAVNNLHSIHTLSASRGSGRSSSPSRMSMSELNYKDKRRQKRNQEADISSDFLHSEPSVLIRQGMEREKQVLETVHLELSDLSRDLKARSDKMQLEAQRLEQLKLSLEESRKALDKREKSIKKETQQLVALKMKKKEEQLKESTKGIVVKYEEALEQLGRENKRLQSSLKDMVTTNRMLRDQNRSIQAESDEKDVKLEDLVIQVKQAKDRNERLKSMLSSSTPTPPPVSATKESEDMFIQMKKILAIHTMSKKPEVTESAVQSDSSKSKANESEVELKRAVQKEQQHPLLKLLYLIMNKDNLISFYDAVLGAYPFLKDEVFKSAGAQGRDREISQAVFDSYLELIFHGSNHLSSFQSHIMGEQVYNSLVEYKSQNLTLYSTKTVLLLHLIPLVSIKSQSEVTDALLEGVLALSSSVASQQLLVQIGLDSLVSLLKDSVTTRGLASTANLLASILLSMTSQEEFFVRLYSLMDELEEIISQTLPFKTVEAIIVILQKLTSKGKQIPPGMLEKIKNLKNQHQSDFLDINIKSILLLS